MSTITQLVTAVVEDTGRVDKTTLIARYVRAGIIKAHELDYFPLDRVAATQAVIAPGTSTAFALPTRWRKFFSIFPCDSGGLTAGLQLELDQAGFMDSFDAVKKATYRDYYKVVGNQVLMETDASISYVRIIYWAYPDLALDTAETWITLRYPQAIVDFATAYVQNKLGNPE